MNAKAAPQNKIPARIRIESPPIFAAGFVRRLVAPHNHNRQWTAIRIVAIQIEIARNVSGGRLRHVSRASW